MTAQIPNSAFACAMLGPNHRAPATHIVDAQVHIRGDIYAPLRWMTCSDVACITASHSHAEMVGKHVDLRPLTGAEAEELTGLVAQ